MDKTTTISSQLITKRYQVISEATGKVIDSSNDYKESLKLLLKATREEHFVKLYDWKENKTLMSNN